MGEPGALLDAVRNSYEELQSSDPIWLQAVIETVGRALDTGLGLCAWFYDASDLGNVRLFHPTSLRAKPGALEAVFASASHPDMPREVLAEHWATPAGPASAALQQDGADFPPWRDTFYRLGIRDIVTVNAYDVDGRGMAVNAFCAEPARLSEAYVQQLEHVAAHLMAMNRLRRRGLANSLDSAEAVIMPNGTVVNAVGQARHQIEDLSAAARIIERARGRPQKSSPATALESWRALVDARWSIVNFVDADGKRFLVARVNEPEVPSDRRELTQRERQVVALAARGHSNKLIAYDLGIAEGTVGAHLNTSMRKLGVTSRAGLVTAFSSAPVGGPDEASPVR